jgi:hypothetical protein
MTKDTIELPIGQRNEWSTIITKPKGVPFKTYETHYVGQFYGELGGRFGPHLRHLVDPSEFGLVGLVGDGEIGYIVVDDSNDYICPDSPSRLEMGYYCQGVVIRKKENVTRYADVLVVKELDVKDRKEVMQHIHSALERMSNKN